MNAALPTRCLAALALLHILLKVQSRVRTKREKKVSTATGVSLTTTNGTATPGLSRGEPRLPDSLRLVRVPAVYNVRLANNMC